ncbi:MAG: transcriptional regulator [Myxococcales bacterium]|nr:transcriptional regulator [Myxococcales bacterium]
MKDRQWDEQLRSFLQRTGDELKRAGEDIKSEAQRLIEEVKDPKKHKKVKEGLREVRTWAKKTAEEIAEMVEKGVKKAEDAFRGSPPPKQAAKVSKTVGGKRVKSRPSRTVSKTIGRKRS